MAVDLVVALALLVGNFFFVAVEFAITRARPGQVEELVDAGTRGAGSLRHAVEHIDSYLSACQLGITVCSIGLGIFAEPTVRDAVEPVLDVPAGVLGIGTAALALGISYAIVSTAHVVAGELAPKSLAIARNVPTGLLLAPPMRIFYLATRPVVDSFNWLGNLLLRPFGIPPASEAGHAPHSEGELRRLIRSSEREGEIRRNELELAENIFLFGDRRAREVMIARPEVVFVTETATVSEAADLVEQTGFTRFPVCEERGELDATVGALHAKDLVRCLRGDPDTAVAEVTRPIERVSESIRLDELLEKLRTDRQHLAVVENEHGTAVGIVTMDDILGEIVGEIPDEFERAGEQLVVQENGDVRVGGASSARAVLGALGVEWEGFGHATIGGLIVERLGRVPRSGEELDFGAWRAEIAEADETRVIALVARPARA